MKISKDGIKSGMVKFLENEVVGNIGDKPVKIAVALMTNLLKQNSGVIDRLLNHPVVAMFLASPEDNKYELEGVFEALSDTMREYGNLEFEIPLVKGKLTFNANDISALKRYIEESE